MEAHVEDFFLRFLYQDRSLCLGRKGEIKVGSRPSAVLHTWGSAEETVLLPIGHKSLHPGTKTTIKKGSSLSNNTQFKNLKKKSLVRWEGVGFKLSLHSVHLSRSEQIWSEPFASQTDSVLLCAAALRLPLQKETFFKKCKKGKEKEKEHNFCRSSKVNKINALFHVCACVRLPCVSSLFH